jgi:hypothetical protein
MTAISQTSTTAPTTALDDRLPRSLGSLGSLGRRASVASRSIARLRASLATAIVRGQMGPVHETEVGRRTGARI